MIRAWTSGRCFSWSGRSWPRGILVALGAARISVPSLVAFLALGMLLGSDGPGGIYFDDVELARTVGTVALAAILFEGGLRLQLHGVAVDDVAEEDVVACCAPAERVLREPPRSALEQS